MCHRKQLSIVKLQNFTKFYSFLMCLMLLNSVHKLKCENKFNSFIHVIPHLPFTMAMFWAPFLRTFPKFYFAPLCKLSKYLKVMAVSIPSALEK